MPSCANALTVSQSSAKPPSAAPSFWKLSSTRAVHCASACSAIHWFLRAKCSSGADAGLRAAQSSGWARPARARHRRLQKRTGHGVGPVAAHGTTSGDAVSGVEQCPHAAEVIWRSYRLLRVCCRVKIGMRGGCGKGGGRREG